MKSFVLGAAAFATSALALVPRGDTCCFGLTANGAQSGTVGQLSDGQNRIGGGLPAGSYCISGGGITDGQGRGCILTPPTTQFQCDSGASPTTGFAVGSGGSLTYNGNTQFYACATGDNGEYNIYTTTSSAETGCVPITLTANNCAPAAPSPTPSPTPSPPKTCPAALSGDYQFPHLIVPVNSASPNTAYGTSYNGEITSTISSLFNFDIPSSYAGKTCSLVFLFPEQSQLQTSSFTFSGDGKVDAWTLASPATQSTTYANAPKPSLIGEFTFAPGNSYVLDTFACPANTAIGFELTNAGSTSLTYFQDYNPSPIGLYITVC